MWKKAVYVTFATFICSAPAIAVETPAASEITLSKVSATYPSSTFNAILEAHGLSFKAESAARVPASYASLNGTEPLFNALNVGYSPKEYHDIFTAYGLELTLENARKIQVRSYVRVVEDAMIFDDSTATLYNGWELRNILSAYTMSMVDEAPVIAEVVEPPTVKKVEMIGGDGDGGPDMTDDCPDTPAGVKPNERGCWESSADVLFELNKAIIKTEYYKYLSDFKRILDLNPGLKIVVQGHTCNLGTSEYNKGLSERRAKAVVEYLITEVGVNPASVSWIGYGEDRPGYSNETEEERAKNRRVQFERWK